MHEKVVESWLDSASERSYQAAFCQMLVAQGHRIVHSTRHSPIEFGKDIVSVAPDGVPCAFQLKGNPGSRLTLSGFRAIEGQIRELVDYALPYSNLAREHHRSFLVTNGYVDEEASRAIEALNESNSRAGYPERTVTVWGRGELLELALELERGLWPKELDDTRRLLAILHRDGAESLPWEDLTGILTDMLGLREGDRREWSREELRRRFSAAALITSICLTSFYEAKNYFAAISAWTLLAVSVIGSCQRYNMSFERDASPTVETAKVAINDALIDLAEEACNRDNLLEGEPLIDGEVYRGRVTLLLGLLSLLWIQLDENVLPTSISKSEVEEFLDRHRSELLLWGEGAVPSLLYLYWALRRKDSGAAIDGLLVSALEVATEVDEKNMPRGLPGPYWTFEDVTRNRLSAFLGGDHPMSEEGPSRSSYYAEALLHLLVRTNLKSQCKAAWADFSRYMLSEYKPVRKWQYCLPRTEEGVNEERKPPLRKEWNDLVHEARRVDCDVIPKPLLDHPFLLALFVQLFPARGTGEVIRYLGYRLNPVWMIPPPIKG